MILIGQMRLFGSMIFVIPSKVDVVAKVMIQN